MPLYRLNSYVKANAGPFHLDDILEVTLQKKKNKGTTNDQAVATRVGGRRPLFAPAANAQSAADQAESIDEGFRVFTQETFGGNGRTCATCHVPSEGYNIFPATIKKLDKQERAILFASSVPGFENVKLIESHALFNISGGPAPFVLETARNASMTRTAIRVRYSAPRWPFRRWT